MPFNPTGPGNLPVERIKPITAEWIGDVTAGGSANIQSFLDARRFIRAKVANLAARNALSTPQDGDLVLVLANDEGNTQLDRYKASSTSWITVAVEGGSSSGGGGVMGTPVLVTETSTGSNLYTLPYTRKHPMVWVDGSLQVKDSDYTVNGAGQVSFTPALSAGSTVIASCALFLMSGGEDVGSGAMTAPVVVPANAGTSNATYLLPGTGAEMVWKGGAIQVRDLDYTRTADAITFVADNIPEVGETVVISVAMSPLSGTDAATLGGSSSSTSATAHTIAKRDATGVLKATNHASLGTAAAEGTVIVANASGMVPPSALPAAGLVTSVADVAAIKAISSPQNGALVTTDGLGIYVFNSSYTGLFDDQTAIQPNSGSGGWVLRAISSEVLYAGLVSELSVRDMDIQTLVFAFNDLAAKYNDLATKFNAHTHTYNPTLTSASVATSSHNQSAASTDAITAVAYNAEI